MIISGSTARAAAAIADWGLFPPTRVEVEAVERMSLSRFMGAGIAVAIVSSFLPGEIWLTADRAVAARVRGERAEAVTYTGPELGRILEAGPSRETLRTIHAAKAVFGGRLVKINAGKK